MYVYFYSLHVSGNHVPIIRRINHIIAIPGICHSVWTTIWYAGAYAPAYQTVVHMNYLCVNLVYIQRLY